MKIIYRNYWYFWIEFYNLAEALSSNPVDKIDWYDTKSRIGGTIIVRELTP